MSRTHSRRWLLALILVAPRYWMWYPGRRRAGSAVSTSLRWPGKCGGFRAPSSLGLDGTRFANNRSTFRGQSNILGWWFCSVPYALAKSTWHIACACGGRDVVSLPCRGPVLECRPPIHARALGGWAVPAGHTEYRANDLYWSRQRARCCQSAGKSPVLSTTSASAGRAELLFNHAWKASTIAASSRHGMPAARRRLLGCMACLGGKVCLYTCHLARRASRSSSILATCPAQVRYLYHRVSPMRPDVALDGVLRQPLSASKEVLRFLPRSSQVVRFPLRHVLCTAVNALRCTRGRSTVSSPHMCVGSTTVSKS